MMTDAVRILVVDDDPIAVSILCNALSDMGTIHVATGGAAALRLAAAHPINLVLLDIVMPTMDGFAICRALRRDHPGLHVVFLTAANEPDVEVQALAVGGHDFIGKPINPPVVRARVALHLELQAQETARKRMAERLRLSEERLRLLTDNAVDNLWITDADGTFTYSSPSIATLAGYTPSEMLQQSLDAIFTDDSLARINDYLARLNTGLHAGSPVDVFRGELALRRRDGSIVWTEVIASPLCDGNGRFVELVGATRDISERRRLEAELHRQNLLLTTVLTNLDAHVYMKDREGRFLYVNRAVAELFGRRVEEVVGHVDAEFIPAADLDEIRAVDLEVFASGARQRREERLTDQEGTARYYWSVKVPLVQAGTADALIGISTDITELRQLREELERQATTDCLTGLANRRHFHQQASRHFQQAERYGEALSLLALDIDHFKSINDNHGHPAGDSVLRGLAQHFRQGIRAIDLMGRIGGEEFAILLPRTDLDGAVELAERLRETLTQQRFEIAGGSELGVAVSIGAASLRPMDASLDILCARADQALYRAKAAGRNRVETIEERIPGKRACILHLMWKSSYDCGDPVIDREHRALFHLANELLDCASAEVAPQAFRMALDALLAHLVGHFAHEEAILRRHGYADIERHAELHQCLIARALALRAQAEQEGLAFGDLVQFLAQDVVARHMLHADRRFYGLFANAARGGS